MLLHLASPLVDGIDRLQESFEAHIGDLSHGELNIAAGESTILYVLPEPTHRFVEDYPGIHMKLHNVTGRDGLAMIHADEADFAIGSMLEIPDDVVYRPSQSFNTTLITPLDHPLADKQPVELEDIGQYGLILPPPWP